ncbi:MAG: DNA polymerase I, partial [Alphaproteobacteria bacterium]
AGEIKQPKRRQTLLENAEMARLSRDLVRLKDDVPVRESLESFAVRPPDAEALISFLRAQGFKSMIARLEGRLGAAAKPAAPAHATAAKPAESAYELVQSEAALAIWVERARELGLVAFDTETTSLDAMRAELVGFSLALEPGRACYVPLGHGGADDGTAARQIPLATALERLKPLLKDPAVLKLGHNIKYDMLVLSQPRYGVRIEPVDDSMVMSYVLESGLHGHGLKELSALHLGHEQTRFEDVAGRGKAQLTFDKVGIDDARDYAAADADMTLRLNGLLKRRLVEDHLVTVYETLERPLIPVLVDMERAGVKVDVEELRRLSADFAGRIEALEAEIHKLAGRPFNIGSPKQLGQLLFDEMGLGAGKKSGKSGAYATGADVLEELAEQGHELPSKVLDWRQLTKLKSTYADSLVAEINPETGRVHTSYAMAVASTGRLSSTDPNLQNIPVRTEEGRKIRRAFVAERGFKFLSLDYSQIELRLLAHVADVKGLKEAFRAGLDIHRMTASQVFGEPIESMSAETRRRAKAINFGIIYGISPFGLSRQLGIPQAEAARYIQAYFERYPGIRDYMERTRAFCRAHGYVTTAFGRKIHMPGINDKNPARRGFVERQAINAPLQGAAADVIKRAMVRVPAALEGARLGARMLLQVHDELLFEVPEGELEETTTAVKGVMERAAHLSVPLVVDAGVGANWAEAH